MNLFDAPNYANATFPQPRVFQERAHELLRQGRRAGHKNQLMMAPTGAGKCLGRGTPVLMADGSIKPVELVRVGDRLMGDDGTPRNVLSIAQGREMLYRVAPKKGDEYVVNASHLLSLRKTPGSDGMRLADGSRIAADADHVVVRADVFAQSNATVRHCLKGWRCDGVERFDRAQDWEELPMPPYVLGAWLGDGTQGRAAISKPPCKMVDAWVAYGESIGYRVSRSGNDCPTWLLTNGRDGLGVNLVANWLELMGVSNRRHIPADYKYGSYETRLAILAGLIDSDGHVTHKGCDWISVSKELADDFAFVCRSLGFACYVKECEKGIAKSGFVGTYWRASVSGDLSVIPTLDKRIDRRAQKKRHLVHGIKVAAIGEGDYFGFEIDGNRLFCLGDFTVTHNTYLGLRIIHEALQRGKRAIFVCDRTTLINQTSEVADSYGLSAHSVLQANHWRYDPAMPFQIASAQTLARREWPGAEVIVIDEAHTQMTVWTEHIQTCAASVIGLSATPFSPGLGKLFSNLVNATTMKELTDAGVLVPMKPFTCTRANMAGAATAGGEWTDQAAEERGMAIIGDVVTEWSKYGQGRKTIVFGSTIKHCEEICRQFNEAGVMAAVFTSLTTAAEREQLLKEYRKPDSALRVLVSVEALAKGFDVKDVGCVVDCRPLRKSLSTAIQMWGRGLRSSPETGKQDCVARDTLVLTDKGEVRIQDITFDHKVWDGQNFVSHAGAVCRGVQRVIEYDDLIATPDHEVMTNDGWKRFEEAAGRQLRITRTGFGGKPVRFADHRFEDDAGRKLQPARGGAMRQMRGAALCALSQHPQTPGDCGVSTLQWAEACSGAGMAVSAMPSADATLQQPESGIVQELRRAWHRVSIQVSERCRALGGFESGSPGRQDYATGPAEQFRPLRAGKPTLDNSCWQHEQHARLGRQDSIHIVSQELPSRELRRCNAQSADKSGPDGRADKRALADALPQAEREVWDILNAGPLQRFTANGRLVHNCILLDHSGNLVRFADDYSRIFYEGLDALDAGEKLDKSIRRDDEEKEIVACPSCGFKPFGRRCIACGFQPARAALVEHEVGEMREVFLGKTKLADDRRHLWEQVATYARAHSAAERQRGRASHLFKDMTGSWPPRDWDIETTPNVVITRAVLNKIRSMNIAFSKRRAA